MGAYFVAVGHSVREPWYLCCRYVVRLRRVSAASVNGAHRRGSSNLAINQYSEYCFTDMLKQGQLKHMTQSAMSSSADQLH